MEPLLKKYKIREAIKPRNVRLTFRNDGFYKTLKERVGKEIPNINIKKYELKSKVSNIIYKIFTNLKLIYN